MARTKKQAVIKEPIRLRTKALANGNKSLYLDKYVSGRREYEFLKLYLIPEIDSTTKARNINTLQAANAIKAQRLMDLANDTAGIIKPQARGKMRLVDWIDAQIEAARKDATDKTARIYRSLRGHVVNFAGEGVMMKDVTPEFVRGFGLYLTEKVGRYGRRLSRGSQYIYFKCLNTLLNKAVVNGIIPTNPYTRVSQADKPRLAEGAREYLTIEEVKKLIDSPCHSVIKCAFLFSCFCGLRLSDVKALTWENVYVDRGQHFAKIIIKKTQKPFIIPLSAEAVRWMPERRDIGNSTCVFDLTSVTDFAHAYNLRKWAERAGLTKHITFHVARHTFATMMLTAGADLYTVSKLLGHSNVATTQIYAKIVDAKKVEAVNLVNGIFGTPGKEGEQ